jgi:alpha-galactosidase
MAKETKTSRKSGWLDITGFVLRCWSGEFIRKRWILLLILTARIGLAGGILHASDDAAVQVNWEQDFSSLADQLELPTALELQGRTFSRVLYPEHQALEWQVRLRPASQTLYNAVQELNTAELMLDFVGQEKVQLRWSEGSHALPSDFKPNLRVLKVGESVTLRSFGGRSSDGAMPFFQLASPQGGIVLALGWSGDWESSFELKPNGQVAVRGGLQRAGFSLEADQEVRLPSLLLMRYEGSPELGVNQFRRLMLHEFSPKQMEPDKLMPLAASVHGMLGFNDTSAEKLLTLAHDINKLNLPLDTYWLDAGWNEGGFPAKQGNMRPDMQRFPQGLKELGELNDRNKQRFLLWFEPERVMRDTELMREHPEWLMKPKGTPVELRYQENDGFHLFDLGNPSARMWMLDRISRQIQEFGVDIFRLDCNLYPSYFWGNAFVEGESVSSEVEYVTGLYEFFDELQKRHPDLLIDSCASGGRRVDFEMIRRSVVLWRSDCTWGDVSSPRNMQAMTYGLSYWLPLHGLGAVGTDPVSLRSGMGYCASFAIQYRNEKDVNRLKDHLKRFVPIRDLYSADFYPLTAWSLDGAQPIAWQFHDPKKGQGIVQVFRGKDAAGENKIRLPLAGLELNEVYELVDWDGDKPQRKSGREWMDRGIELELVEGEEVAKVLEYRKVGG